MALTDFHLKVKSLAVKLMMKMSAYSSSKLSFFLLHREAQSLSGHTCIVKYSSTGTPHDSLHHVAQIFIVKSYGSATVKVIQ